MNKTLVNLIITVVLAWIFSALGMDWWSVMLAASVAAYIIPLKGFKVFLMPFLGILLFWGLSAYLLSSTNDFILAKQIGVLFSLGESPYLVILITGIIGGLAAGIAGIFVKQLRSLRSKS